MRLAGIPGVLICSIGCIIPSFIICLTLAHFYYKYRTVSGVQVVLGALRPAVVALIASAGASILVLGLFQTELQNVVLGRGKQKFRGWKQVDPNPTQNIARTLGLD